MNLFRRDFYLPPHQMANSLLWTQISKYSFSFIYIYKKGEQGEKRKGKEKGRKRRGNDHTNKERYQNNKDIFKKWLYHSSTHSQCPHVRFHILYIYIYIYQTSPLAYWVECSPIAWEDRGSIPGRVMPKTQKMVFDTSLLNTQHYNVRNKGKVEQSRKRSYTLPYMSM